MALRRNEARMDRLISVLLREELLTHEDAQFIDEGGDPEASGSKSAEAPKHDGSKRRRVEPEPSLEPEPICYAHPQESCEQIPVAWCTGQSKKYKGRRLYCGPCMKWLLSNESIVDPEYL